MNSYRIVIFCSMITLMLFAIRLEYKETGPVGAGVSQLTISYSVVVPLSICCILLWQSRISGCLVTTNKTFLLIAKSF